MNHSCRVFACRTILLYIFTVELDSVRPAVIRVGRALLPLVTTRCLFQHAAMSCFPWFALVDWVN